MASATTNIEEDDGELVTLICVDPNAAAESVANELQDDQETVSISTSDVESWDLDSILAHKSVLVKAKRSRIVGSSSYFCGLFCGSFSESSLNSVTVHWNMRSFLSILRFMFGCSLDLNADNFISFHEAALFFGVETLLSHCQVWLNDVTSNHGHLNLQLKLGALIDIWKYGQEHANYLISQPITRYLARNFMWVSSCNSFVDVPYQLLNLCIEHPWLTVDSEKHLCDAILLWLAACIQQSGNMSMVEDGCNSMLSQIRCQLLPLWYLAGKRKCRFFASFAEEGLKNVLRLIDHSSMHGQNIWRDDHSSSMVIRLTECSKKVDLSGCPQSRHILLSTLIPSLYSKDMAHVKNFKPLSLDHLHQLNVDPSPSLSFEAVEEVDISDSPMMDLEDAMNYICKSFPYLRKLRAVNYLNFRIGKLDRLLVKCPQLCDIELTVDISPLVLAKVPIISSSPALAPLGPTGYSNLNQSPHGLWGPSIARNYGTHPSNIARLTLEGRGEITDADLENIARSCPSLCFLNINGCMSATDAGISYVILNCVFLHSLLACDTLFGNKSVLALCAGVEVEHPICSVAHNLQTLHIGGCRGVSDMSFSELLSQTGMIESICLRETQLVDGDLYHFKGCSLKMLDVSETKVSGLALVYVVRQNPGLKILKARGCKYLSSSDRKSEEIGFSSLSTTSKDLYSELASSCQLVELYIGWGFSWFSLHTMKPAIGLLRTIEIGLGASLGPDGLELLPAFCPMLETLIIYFQEISDSLLTSIMQTIKQLHVLALCYCYGEISSLSFQFDMPSLRKLNLERVAGWMTNADLNNLTQSCMNLIELSLIGCKHLNPESQKIISSGWPGLISIHLEDCGQVTAHGVSFIMNCRALEDLLLRHTGRGIPINVIAILISEMPMIRKISLDTCDARDFDFDLLDFSDRCFLSFVKIARCKMQRLHFVGDVKRTPVHKETLVLVWDSKKLTRSVVKERL